MPDGRSWPAVQPPGAAAGDLGGQRLPRSARDRRARAAPEGEARGGALEPAPHPHRARSGVPAGRPLTVRRLLRSGLRARLVGALVVTSAVTLVVAAVTLLPPLDRRLRREEVHS